VAPPKKKADSKPKILIEGFGFIPSESEHHFMVTIPAGKEEDVLISEHYHWDDADARRELGFALGREDNKLRVLLSRHKWEAIADEVRVEFNKRLRKHAIKSGQWKQGRVPIARLFGKELTILAWAIEDADPSLIPVAIKNWLGLAPEERWWLYTMTNAATGHALTGKGKGWRKALRFALTENPVSSYETTERQNELFTLREEAEVWGSGAVETPPEPEKKETALDKVMKRRLAKPAAKKSPSTRKKKS